MTTADPDALLAEIEGLAPHVVAAARAAAAQSETPAGTSLEAATAAAHAAHLAPAPPGQARADWVLGQVRQALAAPFSSTPLKPINYYV